jgi:uncharacterized protein (TIGR02300 family)
MAPLSEPLRIVLVAKPVLGTKRLCPHCGAKFYDLSKDPIVCPKCGSVVEIPAPSARGGRPEAARLAPVAAEPEVPEVQDAELVSLEEADAESTGAKAPAATDDVEEEEELADDGADDTFLEPGEDEDEDVSDIIGGEIENEEET